MSMLKFTSSAMFTFPFYAKSSQSDYMCFHSKMLEIC